MILAESRSSDNAISLRQSAVGNVYAVMSSTHHVKRMATLSEHCIESMSVSILLLHVICCDIRREQSSPGNLQVGQVPSN